MKHPNATIGGAAGAVTILIVFILGELGVDVTPEVAAALTTVLTTLVLLLGRRRPAG